MCRCSELLLNWVSTKIRRRSELMQLLIGMSTSRYLPPSGTAGLARSLVRGKRRVPAPPPRMTARMSSGRGTGAAAAAEVALTLYLLASGLPSRQAMPPMQECDLIMKGGITSGIVYPPAILRLQERYRFRNVGGASAGAIAAAFAAAAEYGRDRGGFEKLEARRRELSTGTFLRDLFQPTARTGPLFDAAYGLWAVR